MSGPEGAQEDKALVDAVLRELREAADRWELLVAEAETTTYSVDFGDIQVVVNSDGKLIELALAPGVVSDYSHSELVDRLNSAFEALRYEAESDNAARYAGGVW